MDLSIEQRIIQQSVFPDTIINASIIILSPVYSIHSTIVLNDDYVILNKGDYVGKRK